MEASGFIEATELSVTGGVYCPYIRMEASGFIEATARLCRPSNKTTYIRMETPALLKRGNVDAANFIRFLHPDGNIRLY